MIAIGTVLQEVRGLDARTLGSWMEQGWVRPAHRAGQPVFEEVDVARVRLIVELRDVVGVGDEAVPVVLSLIDQLHATRGVVRRVMDALEQAGDEPARLVVERLRE